MVGKLIVHGRNREECLQRLNRCIDETVIEGIQTTLPLHKWIINQPEFISGDYTIHWLEQQLEKLDAEDAKNAA
jgi:acetyl-CoA carboxylase biotin carboxylase subunit